MAGLPWPVHTLIKKEKKKEEKKRKGGKGGKKKKGKGEWKEKRGKY